MSLTDVLATRPQTRTCSQNLHDVLACFHVVAVQIRPPATMNATAEMQWCSPVTEDSVPRSSTSASQKIFEQEDGSVVLQFSAGRGRSARPRQRHREPRGNSLIHSSLIDSWADCF